MTNGTNTASTAEDRALDALVELIKSATTPELLEAQTIILRRLALQGDIVSSRVPAPRNITEIGGYLNLLEQLRQTEMRAQALTGILGVAGPNPPLGWLATRPPLAMITLTNDRPAVPAQPGIPLTFAVRSDFSTVIQSALKGLHDKGCTLPLLSMVPPLPQASPEQQPPDDPLPYLGRTLYVVPSTALRDPKTDPLAVARAQGTTDPFQVVARVISPGPAAVAPANWDVLQCDETSCNTVAANNTQYVAVGLALANAGFYQKSPLPQPTSLASLEWALFTNVTGLVHGMTKLVDELSLLYSPAEIAGSVFSSRMHWVWDGSSFSES